MPNLSPPSPLAPPPHRNPSPRREELWQRRINLEEHFGLRFGSELHYRHWYDWAFARFSTLLIRMSGMYPQGRRNTRDFEVKRLTFHYQELPPALEGFRILHLSDHHFPAFDPDFAEAVVAMVAKLEADLCLMTGDFRFGYYGPSDHVYPAIARMIDAVRPRFGAYGVLGNHDLGEMAAPLEQAGLRMLVNEGEALQVQDTLLWLGGVDDAHRFRADSVGDAAEGAPAGAFKILLAHTPQNAEEGAAHGFDLCLSGHTHGGQIAFPIIGPPLMNARCPYAYCEGHWRCGNMQGYTTRGLGTTDIPFRFNCRPEATVITLARQ